MVMKGNNTLDKIVTHKNLLMEIFDEMFGHGGYSGIAF
jgi:hypothetical protein